MGKRDERNRAEFGLKRDRCRIENRSGGAHPGAEQGEDKHDRRQRAAGDEIVVLSVRLAQARDGNGEQAKDDGDKNAGIKVVHERGQAFRVTSDAT